jgi:putative intracellular protease/amidase
VAGRGVISRGYKHDPAFVKLVENTTPVAALDVDRFDAVVIAARQGPMFTFDSAAALHDTFVPMYEAGKTVAAQPHGVAVLRYARLSTVSPW